MAGKIKRFIEKMKEADKQGKKRNEDIKKGSKAIGENLSKLRKMNKQRKQPTKK